jgi:hypothetical protein
MPLDRGPRAIDFASSKYLQILTERRTDNFCRVSRNCGMLIARTNVAD